jgi:hypothetical protein
MRMRSGGVGGEAEGAAARSSCSVACHLCSSHDHCACSSNDGGEWERRLLRLCPAAAAAAATLSSCSFRSRLAVSARCAAAFLALRAARRREVRDGLQGSRM